MSSYDERGGTVRLDRISAAWDRLAAEDPLWAVYALPGTKGNRWDPADFYATGAQEVSRALTRATALGLCEDRGAALDFGCGVGRLSYALGDSYASVVGLDVSDRMLSLAAESNPHGDRLTFLRNDRPDLRMFEDGTFDLVYTSLVLQHMPIRFSTVYLAEFIRVLKPGGTAVFHIPAGTRPTVKGMLFRWAPRHVLEVGQRFILRYPAPMEMHGIPPERVRAILNIAGADVVAVDATELEGSQWHDHQYFARKRLG
jgi:SAM-dependent methyltransferase